MVTLIPVMQWENGRLWDSYGRDGKMLLEVAPGENQQGIRGSFERLNDLFCFETRFDTNRYSDRHTGAVNSR